MLIDLTLNFTYYISVDLLVTTFYKQRKNLNTLQVFFLQPPVPPFSKGNFVSALLQYGCALLLLKTRRKRLLICP